MGHHSDRLAPGRTGKSFSFRFQRSTADFVVFSFTHTDALLADLDAAVPQKATISQMPAPAANDATAPEPAKQEPSPPPPVTDDEPASVATGSSLNELDQLLEALNSPALLEFEEGE